MAGTTANTCSFWARRRAASMLRLDSRPSSSSATIVMVRPWTPPSALARSSRALAPDTASPHSEVVGPVMVASAPTRTSVSVTPRVGSSAVCSHSSSGMSTSTLSGSQVLWPTSMSAAGALPAPPSPPAPSLASVVQAPPSSTNASAAAAPRVGSRRVIIPPSVPAPRSRGVIARYDEMNNDSRMATKKDGGGLSRREQRRLHHQEISRAQLLDAAEEVFGRKGFHAATLKEVAELAEFSVGSVYSFFESKDDLFRQIFLRRGEEFMARIREVLEPDGSPV